MLIGKCSIPVYYSDFAGNAEKALGTRCRSDMSREVFLVDIASWEDGLAASALLLMSNNVGGRLRLDDVNTVYYTSSRVHGLDRGAGRHIS